jgi:hypothetical protein
MTSPEPSPWSDPTADRPVDAPAPLLPAPFDAPAPFVSPDSGRSGDFSASVVPGPVPGTPAMGYDQSSYQASAPGGATYAGYGVAPSYAPPPYPGYPAPAYPAQGYPPQGYPATGYPAPGYPGYPGYPPYGGFGVAPRKTSGLATASMVMAIVGLALIVCYGVGGLLAAAGAIMGHVARRQIKTSQEGGDGMAKAGIIVGWIAFGLAIAFWGLVGVGVWLGNS